MPKDPLPRDEAPPALPHILLVDDHELVREILGGNLEGLGYRVTRAANGVEALEQIEILGENLDLVVSDVNMPEMGGERLAREAFALRPDLPILLLSGFAGTEAPSLTAEGRVLEVLQKPIELEALAGAIRRALGATAQPLPEAR